MNQLQPQTIQFLDWLGPTSERARILALFEELRGAPFVIEEEPPPAPKTLKTAAHA